MSSRFKVSIVGAGNVGASCAMRIAERDYADIVLVDIVEGLPQGKALDIQQSGPLLEFDTRLMGSNGYEETADSDVVVVTAGITRRPGMSRDDLLLMNMEIVRGVTRGVVERSPECIMIIATNPIDAMVYLALHDSGFAREKVLGLSGVLDAARLASFVAAELNVSVEDVDACVLGEHGGSMVIVPRLTTVHGDPITELLPSETVERLVQRTVAGGAEVVGLLKTGSAFYAPSAAIAMMVDAILLDKMRILPCAIRLDGEYGITDTVISVPAKLGRNGVDRVVELTLTANERAAVARSADVVRELIGVMKLG